MRFATWNSQGDFTSSEKSAIVKKLYAGTNVLFVQEGGVDKTWGDGLFKTTQGVSVGAKNERCTNYVLVSDTTWKDKAATVVFTTVGGGVAGRKPAAVQIDKTLLVSWHSVAAGDNSDTRQLLAESFKKLDDTGLSQVVIGGDFNAAPGDIEAMIVRMAMARGGSRHFAGVIAPRADTPTHSSGKVLDFFVVLMKEGAPAGEIWVAPVKPSDHDPVFLELK